MIVAHFFEITERQAYRDHSDYVLLHSHLYVDMLSKNEAKQHKNEAAYSKLQGEYDGVVNHNETLQRRLQGMCDVVCACLSVCTIKNK